MGTKLEAHWAAVPSSPSSACLSGRTIGDLFLSFLLPNSLFVSQLIQYSGQWCLKFIQKIFPNPSDLDRLNLLIYTDFFKWHSKSFLWAARFARLPVLPSPGPCTLTLYWHMTPAAIKQYRICECTHTQGPFLIWKRLIRKKTFTSSSTLFFSFTSSQF